MPRSHHVYVVFFEYCDRVWRWLPPGGGRPNPNYMPVALTEPAAVQSGETQETATYSCSESFPNALIALTSGYPVHGRLRVKKVMTMQHPGPPYRWFSPDYGL